MSCHNVRCGTFGYFFIYFWKVQFVANGMASKWPRSGGHFDSYAHSTEVLSKRPFLVHFLEYGSENGPYLRVEWSKIDATNAVVLEKDCSTIAVLQLSTKFLRVSSPLLPKVEISKNWFLTTSKFCILLSRETCEEIRHPIHCRLRGKAA